MIGTYLGFRQRRTGAMSTKTKLAILELIAGAFGWGWMIAGGFAVYYLVMAVGFDGSWSSFIIALVIGGIAKWLAKGFEDNKRRVAFEANLMANGMSPAEAANAWVQADAGGNAPEPDSTVPEAHLMTEENQRKAEDRLQVISDFGKFVESNPTGAEIRDIKFLPHDKETILDAICLEIVREEDEARLEALKAGALILADYQEDVGDEPLSLLGVDLTSVDTASMSNDELVALAGQISDTSDNERYKTFEALVQEDQRKILAKVLGADKVRRDMPENKKKEILG
jgi:hypothetical protein